MMSSSADDKASKEDSFEKEVSIASPTKNRTHSVDNHQLSRGQSNPHLANDESGMALRSRANTEPVDLMHAASGLGAGTMPLENQSINQSSQKDDEDIKRAMAMAQVAQAIQDNPHMTPDEIRELLAKEHIETQAPVTKIATESSGTLVPNRLANMMFSGSSATSDKATFRERARGRFNELLAGSTARVGNTFATEDMSVSSTANTARAGNMVAAKDLSVSSTAAGELKREILPTASNSSTSSKDGLRLHFRHMHSVKNARSPPISPSPTDTPEIVTNLPLSEENLLPNLSQSASATGNGPNSDSPRSSPIRISGIAWKRRGGMGKFSTTAAWERRRIELQGTKLLYYLRDASEEENPILPSDSKDIDILSSMSGVSTPVSVDANDAASEGVVVAKRSTWLEQAASNWVAGNEDPTAPRGYIDLAKEKATVHAAFGHSGAPSPFAISIKVRGETKWKLCFDYHRTQMEWMAAITDVVVQNSVDSYNAALLQSVDPSNQTENALFHSPSVAHPPSRDVDGGHRLWTTEFYVCSNKMGINSFNVLGNETPEGRSTAIDEHTNRSEDGSFPKYHDPIALKKENERIVDAAKKTWVVPDKNVIYVAGVLNLALLYARASSTTMESFWYLVVLANLGFYLCLAKEPDWRSVLSEAHGVNGECSVNADQRKSGDLVHADSSKKVPGKAKTPSYVPIAGCSTVKLENPTDDPVNGKGEHFAGWRIQPGESLMVRSHGYTATKVKVPSPGELYDLLAVDIFESPSRYPDMAPRVKLPKLEFNDGVAQKTWRSPDIFVISIALPTDPPKMGRNSSDGGGYTITMYFGMRQETRDILKRVTKEGYDNSSEPLHGDPQKNKVNAVRLFEEWCRRAPTDPKFQTRFKVVPNAHNLKEIGMPGWISKYNGKPFLIKRPGQTGFLYSHPELSCMEFDISLHPFPYLAKQAICFMKDSYFKKILVTFGFVIEGKSDDELPECLIGSMQLCYPDPLYAIQAEDFFSGAANRSTD